MERFANHNIVSIKKGLSCIVTLQCQWVNAHITLKLALRQANKYFDLLCCY